jgi:antirestriction protein ArdC
MKGNDVYENLTKSIIEQLEKGVAPWVKPWSTLGVSDSPFNLSTKNAYHGANTLILSMAAMLKGYTSNAWLGMGQGNKMGAKVRKGEHPTWIIIPNRIVKTEKDADGNEVKKSFVLFNSAQIYNAEQFENLELPAPVEAAPFEALADAEDLIKQTGAVIKHGGASAFYSLSFDSITVPETKQFPDAASYYATVLHELGHWTGHESRLKRDFSGRFGEQAYAAEELVAELTAAFVCSDLGIPSQMQNTAAYLGHWAKLLKDNKRALWTASSAAKKAADFITNGASAAAPTELVAA